MTTQPITRPETFLVGETVAMVIGEFAQRVTVAAVKGKTVTVLTASGRKRDFVARDSDGRHVSRKHMNAVVMPDMIAHYRVTEPAKPTFWTQVKSFFQ